MTHAPRPQIGPLTAPRRPPLSLDRPRIMGILNATPDSFSDAGHHLEVDTAVYAGLEMARRGAAIIDVGGESTRPGAERTPAETQVQRVIPVIEQLREALDARGDGHVWISVDTTLAEVARPALDAGASMLNDVRAGRDDPQMLALAARHQVPIVLMHMQGQPADMQEAPHYDDVVGQVEAFLHDRAAAAEAAGVAADQIVLDPGIGFGKTLEHNLTLLRNLHRLTALPQPVLLGASRKGFIARLSPDTAETPTQRMPGTCATTALGVAAGVAIFRVHDVASNRQAAEIAHAITTADDG